VDAQKGNTGPIIDAFFSYIWPEIKPGPTTVKPGTEPGSLGSRTFVLPLPFSPLNQPPITQVL